MKTPLGKKITFLLILSLLTASLVAPITTLATSVPTPVDGRILPPNLTGDTVNWVEIAQYDNYSLIVRSSYLNWYPQPNKYNDPMWQYVPYSGGTTSYAASSLYTRINSWFNGTNPSQYADNLKHDARIRQYSMENNAKLVPGTASTKAGLTNGFSTPSYKQRGTGNDVAFVLSFSESANFISSHSFVRGRMPTTDVSSTIAVANYQKIKIPPVQAPYHASGAWLRSPGDITGTVGAISQELNYRGRAFQQYIPYSQFERAYMYPALWVDKGIFEVKVKATLTIEHKLQDSIRDLVNFTPHKKTTHDVYVGDKIIIKSHIETIDGYDDYIFEPEELEITAGNNTAVIKYLKEIFVE